MSLLTLNAIPLLYNSNSAIFHEHAEGTLGVRVASEVEGECGLIPTRQLSLKTYNYEKAQGFRGMLIVIKNSYFMNFKELLMFVYCLVK